MYTEDAIELNKTWIKEKATWTALDDEEYYREQKSIPQKTWDFYREKKR
jgi:hypothetical protein